MRRGVQGDVQGGGVQATGVQSAGIEGASLATLFSRLLLAYAVEFERESEVSLAICANVLRLVGSEGSLVRDLPRVAGISKEAVAVAVIFLVKGSYATVKAAAGKHDKMISLTTKGRGALGIYWSLAERIEEGWQTRFGAQKVAALRGVLEKLAAAKGEGGSLLLQGAETPTAGWRAKEAPRGAWPWFPMVLHRGGFPDGS